MFPTGVRYLISPRGPEDAFGSWLEQPREDRDEREGDDREVSALDAQRGETEECAKSMLIKTAMVSAIQGPKNPLPYSAGEDADV